MRRLYFKQEDILLQRERFGRPQRPPVRVMNHWSNFWNAWGKKREIKQRDIYKSIKNQPLNHVEERFFLRILIHFYRCGQTYSPSSSSCGNSSSLFWKFVLRIDASPWHKAMHVSIVSICKGGSRAATRLGARPVWVQASRGLGRWYVHALAPYGTPGLVRVRP